MFAANNKLDYEVNLGGSVGKIHKVCVFSLFSTMPLSLAMLQARL